MTQRIYSLLLPLLLMACFLSPMVQAQSSPAQQAVAAMSDKIFYVKPNLKADYYIYLKSASWCAPCVHEMPRVVQEYAKMKKSGRVELILLVGEQSQKDALAYLKKYHMKCPAMVYDAKLCAGFAGFADSENAFPYAVIVDKDGKLLASGSGSVVLEWQSFCL